MRTLSEIFWLFFKIGFFTLGGGYAMLPLIEREVAERKRWLGEREFLDALALAQSVPGPIAFNAGVFVGYRRAGFPGAVAGGAGVVAPAFLCMAVIAAFFTGVKDDPAIQAIFAGIRPVVAALVAASVWSLARKARLDRTTGVIIPATAAAVWLGVSPVVVVAALAGAGALFSARPEKDDFGSPG